MDMAVHIQGPRRRRIPLSAARTVQSKRTAADVLTAPAQVRAFIQGSNTPRTALPCGLPMFAHTLSAACPAAMLYEINLHPPPCVGETPLSTVHMQMHLILLVPPTSSHTIPYK